MNEAIGQVSGDQENLNHAGEQVKKLSLNVVLPEVAVLSVSTVEDRFGSVMAKLDERNRLIWGKDDEWTNCGVAFYRDSYLRCVELMALVKQSGDDGQVDQEAIGRLLAKIACNDMNDEMIFYRRYNAGIDFWKVAESFAPLFTSTRDPWSIGSFRGEGSEKVMYAKDRFFILCDSYIGQASRKVSRFKQLSQVCLALDVNAEMLGDLCMKEIEGAD